MNKRVNFTTDQSYKSNFQRGRYNSWGKNGYYCFETYPVIEIHSSWGNPLIIEGWALYPNMIEKIKSDHVFSIWLIAEDDLLRQRMGTSINGSGAWASLSRS